MQKTHRIPLIAAAAAFAVLFAPVADASAGKIVVNSTFKKFYAKKLRITYTSSKGTYTAALIGEKHYRLNGTINGRKLTGSIRTRQAPSGHSYIAKGSGKLGGKKVKISGGGPNSLKTAKLVLRT